MHKKIFIIVLVVGFGIFFWGIKSEGDITVQSKEFTGETAAGAKTAEAQPVVPKVPEKVVIYPKKMMPIIVINAEGKTETKAEAKSSFASVIKDLKDPFQVEFPLAKKGERSEISELLEKKTFNLQGVIVGASRSVALVDDNVLELGDYLNGWKLIGVKKDRVGFKKGSEIKKLYLSLGGVFNGK